MDFITGLTQKKKKMPDNQQAGFTLPKRRGKLTEGYSIWTDDTK
jgi:hypothetical protein